jgi:hypothetical protein
MGDQPSVRCRAAEATNCDQTCFEVIFDEWSGRPGSNRRHSAWEADVLPLNYSRSLFPVVYQWRETKPLVKGQLEKYLKILVRWQFVPCRALSAAARGFQICGGRILHNTSVLPDIVTSVKRYEPAGRGLCGSNFATCTLFARPSLSITQMP